MTGSDWANFGLCKGYVRLTLDVVSIILLWVQKIVSRFVIPEILGIDYPALVVSLKQVEILVIIILNKLLSYHTLIHQKLTSMKFSFQKNVLSSFVVVVATVFFFSYCTPKGDIVQGFKGNITNVSSNNLAITNHFISQDKIEEYTTRYKHFKDSIGGSTQPSPQSVLTDSCSFNSPIVKAILRDPNCIGLRVLQGIGPDSKLHIILVGINADYSTLYIDEPGEQGAKSGIKGTAQANGFEYKQVQRRLVKGGAEMGQMP